MVGAGSGAAFAETTAALPQIPDRTFKVTDYGAVGDYHQFSTEGFKKAVAAVAAAGGGHLIVPAGTYKILPIELTSHLDLHLDPGATIRAPDNFADYGLPDPNQPLPASSEPAPKERPKGKGAFFRRGPRLAPLISARDVTDVAITGSGTIDGSGQNFWLWSDKAARRYPPGRRIVGRPVLISIQGQRLHFDGVTLTNSPMFHLVPRGEDITIENLHIVAPSDSPNTDAMDPGGTRIVIRNCEIDTGDDHVALQSGSHDVLIEHLTCLHGHGISVGSPTRNGLSNVVVRHCTFDGSDNGIRIKSYRGNGGEVHDITYSDITMRYVRRPFDINMRYNGNAGGPTDVGPREADGQTERLPNFHDIHVDRLTVVKSPLAGRIIGIPEEMAHAITFTHVKIDSVRGFLLQDARGIAFEDAHIAPAIGDPLVLANATATYNGNEMSGDAGGPPTPFY